METCWIVVGKSFGWLYSMVYVGVFGNRRIFNGMSKSPMEVSIAFVVVSWASACKDFDGFSINHLIRDWPSCLSSCLLSLDF